VEPVGLHLIDDEAARDREDVAERARAAGRPEARSIVLQRRLCWETVPAQEPPPAVVEIALLKARPETADALRIGLATARAMIARAPGYLGSAFYQGVEDPQSFILRVEWESLEAHVQGFRASPLLAEWRSHFFHLLAETPTVTHYVVFAGQ
jgi:heme-degrading monooxygenase HmoA